MTSSSELLSPVELHDADADADAEDAVFPDEAVLADRARDVVDDLPRLVERAADQQHAELVAAEARHGIRIAHTLADHRRDLAQHVVAREVAARVVDGFEPVEVQVAHDMALAARRARPRAPRRAGARTRGG